MKKWNVANLTFVSVMIALSILLSYLEIPMAFFAPWLKLDFSFVPMMLTGFALGPVAAGCVILLTNALNLFTSDSQMIGQLANVIMAACYVTPALILYGRKKTKKSALVGMALGTVALVLGGLAANKWLLLPLYFGESLASFDVATYMLAAILPFNIVKGAAVSLVTFLLYKRLSNLLHKAAGGRA